MVGECVQLELATCESTNEELKKLASQGVVSRSSVLSKTQTAGRGRQGRTWQSDEGNLFLSFLYEIPSAVGAQEFRATWIPIIVGMGLIKAIRQFSAELGARAFLKWPNDLVFRRPESFAKCGGILCELVSLPDRRVAIIGVGVNVEHSPELGDRETTSLKSELVGATPLPSVAQLRDLLISHSFELLRELEVRGLVFLEKEFFRYSLNQVGENIKWSDKDSTSQGGQVAGLGSFGELIVEQRDSNGNPRLVSLFSVS